MMELFRNELDHVTLISVGHRSELEDYHDRKLMLHRLATRVEMAAAEDIRHTPSLSGPVAPHIAPSAIARSIYKSPVRVDRTPEDATRSGHRRRGLSISTSCRIFLVGRAVRLRSPDTSRNRDPRVFTLTHRGFAETRELRASEFRERPAAGHQFLERARLRQPRLSRKNRMSDRRRGLSPDGAR